MKRSHLLFGLSLFVAACVSEGRDGAEGPRGETGPKGDPGTSGTEAATATATGSDAGARARPLVPVWRDASGVVIPVVSVDHPRGSPPQDLVDLYVQDEKGIVWLLSSEGTYAAIGVVQYAYKSNDCSGDAYTYAFPAMMTFRDTSQARNASRYYLPSTPMETFSGNSRKGFDDVCVPGPTHLMQRMKVSDSVVAQTPASTWARPFRVSLE